MNIRRKIDKQINIRYDEFKAYFNALRSPNYNDKSKFILLANYRSGSTLLASLLNCHPTIFCDGEIFLNFISETRLKKMLSPQLYIQGCIDLSRNNTVYGFNLKISQLDQVRINQLHSSLHENIYSLYKKNWKIIYLQRQNIFRQAISGYLANVRKQWHITEKTNFQPIHIKPEDILEKIFVFQRRTSLEIDILKPIPHLKVFYEQDLLNLENHQMTADKVFNYLGLESSLVQTILQKTSSDNLADNILNYEEIVDFISQTQYAHFLSE
jgi:hypothetical protein